MVTKAKVLKAIEEYIKEAEHQDGSGFWKNFKTIEEVLEDMVRYYADKADAMGK